jgi:hypothetical protein
MDVHSNSTAAPKHTDQLGANVTYMPAGFTLICQTVAVVGSPTTPRDWLTPPAVHGAVVSGAAACSYDWDDDTEDMRLVADALRESEERISYEQARTELGLE